MKTVKVVLAESTFIGASLIGLILAVSSHVGAAITSMQASSAASNSIVMAREASEGARRFDNESAGDRHRSGRGGTSKHAGS